MRELNFAEMSQISGGSNQYNFTSVVDGTITGAVLGFWFGIVFFPTGTAVNTFAFSGICASAGFVVTAARLVAEVADNYYFPPTSQLEAA